MLTTAKTIFQSKMKNARLSRPFTLLEIIIVIALIGVTATMGVGAITSLLDKHYFQREVEQFKTLLQELQIEALTLGSDMEIQMEKEKAVFKSREKILKSETIDLTHVRGLFLNHRATERFTITIFATGRIWPQQLIELRGKKDSLWVDLREPIQIKFTRVKPDDIVLKVPPKQTKGEDYGPQEHRI